MKKLLLLSLMMILSGSFAFSQVYRGSEARNAFPLADMVWNYKAGHTPEYIRLAPEHFFPVDQLQSKLQDAVGISTDLTLSLIRVQKDADGQEHHRVKQLYNNIPVFDADFIAHVKNGQVQAINGTIYKSIEIANTLVMSEEEAFQHALAAIPAERYKWQMPEEEAWLKRERNDPEATFLPKAERVLYPFATGENVQHFYAYVFEIYADKPLKRAEVYVNAENGAVLFVHDLLHIADTPGTAVTKYSGTQEITSDFYNETYRLRETGRGNGVETYDMNEGTSYGNSVDFTDSDNYWDNFNPQFDEIATDAHWGAEKTYDYFWLNYNRNSIDDQGFALKSYVHYDVAYANAFWDGERMTYGDGNGTWSPLTALDICAHEITHGLTSFSANLIYSYESGALNESYSDIFGTAVEFYAKPMLANWLIGEDIGSPIRSMEDPNSMGDPDTYLGDNWYVGSGDNGGVHTNSGVLNYWFYLASVGGSGVNDNGDAYNVTGISVEKAGAIAYRTLVTYLNPSSQYAHARFYSILAAVDLFGGCSAEVEAVTNAFYAIGVGDPFDPTVVADFNSLTTSYCSLPAQVQFSNSSSNGVNYTWDFGDGTGSTAFAPMHTYTTEGTYTVSLSVDGGPCGTDAIVKADFIVIDAPDSPQITSASNCGGAASLTLTALAPDSVKWFTQATGGTAFHTGTTYTTPVLTQTAHYYVQNQVSQPVLFGAKPTNAGGGGNFSSNATHYLVFDALVPLVIKSVKVYAQGAGVRAISLRDANGNTLVTTNVNIPNGESRVDLNFFVPAGTDYRLAGPTSPNLYRNNGGCAYPYQIGGLATVKFSSAGTNPTGYYYFFYDWEVGEPDCSSQRLKISAFINYGDPVAAFTYGAYPLVVTFQNTSTDGNEYVWDFGDGVTSTEENPVHTYAAPALYNVTLTVTNSCGTNTITQAVNVLATGLENLSPSTSIELSPVPAGLALKLHIIGNNLKSSSIHIYDILGNQVLQLNSGDILGEKTIDLDVSMLKAGAYVLELGHAAGRLSKRFVVQ